MKTEKIKQARQGGFSLVEIMVAAGLLGAISLGVMQLTQNMNKDAATMEIKSNILGMRNRIQQILLDQNSCSNTINQLVAGSPQIRNKSDAIVYQAGQKYDNNTVLIDSITLDSSTIPNGTEKRSITIIYKQNRRASRPVRKKQVIEIQVSGDGSTITGCYNDLNAYLETARTEACSDIGGSFNTASGKCELAPAISTGGDSTSTALSHSLADSTYASKSNLELNYEKFDKSKLTDGKLCVYNATTKLIECNKDLPTAGATSCAAKSFTVSFTAPCSGSSPFGGGFMHPDQILSQSGGASIISGAWQCAGSKSYTPRSCSCTLGKGSVGQSKGCSCSVPKGGSCHGYYHYTAGHNSHSCHNVIGVILAASGSITKTCTSTGWK